VHGVHGVQVSGLHIFKHGICTNQPTLCQAKTNREYRSNSHLSHSTRLESYTECVIVGCDNDKILLGLE
jgi:hypothetical protein